MKQLLLLRELSFRTVPELIACDADFCPRLTGLWLHNCMNEQVSRPSMESYQSSCKPGWGVGVAITDRNVDVDFEMTGKIAPI